MFFSKDSNHERSWWYYVGWATAVQVLLIILSLIVRFLIVLNLESPALIPVFLLMFLYLPGVIVIGGDVSIPMSASAVRILFLLAHAALPVIGWFILDKGNYLGKKLIRISLAISVGVAIYTIILIGVSGFAWLESAGLVFPCFVEDLLFIYLLRRAVNVWKPS